jgi:hypothetical protein
MLDFLDQYPMNQEGLRQIWKGGARLGDVNLLEATWIQLYKHGFVARLDSESDPDPLS